MLRSLWSFILSKCRYIRRLLRHSEEAQDGQWYVNHYRCSECGTEWDDEWDCMCNDRCPKCNAEIEPYASEEVEAA